MRTRIDDEMYDYTDALKDVTVTRELADIWKGKRGDAALCMNARCIVRNAAAFPHPVIAVSVQRSVAFVIDKPHHAVRYLVRGKDRAGIKAHDTDGVGEPGTFTLYAPTGRAKLGKHHTKVGGHSKAKPKSRPLPRGERARLLAAVGASSKGAK